jgi:hypothetical protein
LGKSRQLNQASPAREFGGAGAISAAAARHPEISSFNKAHDTTEN